MSISVQRLVWREKGNEELCIANTKILTYSARRFAHGHGSFLGPRSEKTWYGNKPNFKWDGVAEDMMLNFSESGHPVFRGSKRGGNLSTHFCGDEDAAELVVRTIISVNKPSIYGAVADMCDELACRISGCSRSPLEPVAQNNPETTVIPWCSLRP